MEAALSKPQHKVKVVTVLTRGSFQLQVNIQTHVSWAAVGTGPLRSLWGQETQLTSGAATGASSCRSSYSSLQSSVETVFFGHPKVIAQVQGNKIHRSHSSLESSCLGGVSISCYSSVGHLPGFSQRTCHTPLREAQSSSSGIYNSLLVLPKSGVVHQSEIIFSVSMLPSSAFDILVFWAVGEKSWKVSQRSNSHAEQERILLIFNPSNSIIYLSLNLLFLL